MAAVKKLQKVVDLLAKRYEVEEKKGELTDLRDPFLVGAWYILGQHAKRNGQARAFDALRRAKGHTAGQLLDILPEKLNTVCQIAGPYEDARAKELYAYADKIEEKCGQDFNKLFKKPPAEVRKFVEVELRKSRSFADMLLMYSGAMVFAVDSRVARVVSRLGMVKIKSEKDLDEKSYIAVQKMLESECPKETDVMVRAHGLLYRHGSDVCHASNPNCEVCPLVKECLYVKKHPIKPKEPVPERA
jgi:endonuclease III